jgi:hypothetical protein
MVEIVKTMVEIVKTIVEIVKTIVEMVEIILEIVKRKSVPNKDKSDQGDTWILCSHIQCAKLRDKSLKPCRNRGNHGKIVEIRTSMHRTYWRHNSTDKYSSQAAFV